MVESLKTRRSGIQKKKKFPDPRGKTRRLWHILTHELMQSLENSRVNYYTEG